MNLETLVIFYFTLNAGILLISEDKSSFKNFGQRELYAVFCLFFGSIFWGAIILIWSGASLWKYFKSLI